MMMGGLLLRFLSLLNEGEEEIAVSSFF